MKRISILVVVVAFLALTASLVLAEDSPSPTPESPTGGCSGAACR